MGDVRRPPVVETWGSAPHERNAAYPCDGLIDRPEVVFRAVDINAPSVGPALGHHALIGRRSSGTGPRSTHPVRPGDKPGRIPEQPRRHAVLADLPPRQLVDPGRETTGWT